jgi:hypothetical protein
MASVTRYRSTPDLTEVRISQNPSIAQGIDLNGGQHVQTHSRGAQNCIGADSDADDNRNERLQHANGTRSRGGSSHGVEFGLVG